jgi:hypothetical protein
MKCTKCQQQGHRARDCHKFPPPAPALMKEDEEVLQDAEDTVPPPTDVGELLGELLARQEKTSGHIVSVSDFLRKCLINFEQQSEFCNVVAEQMEHLRKEVSALRAEVAEVRQSLSTPPPPPPPPQNTTRPTTPTPQPKRKRNPAVGATPRKPAKQPRDNSPPPSLHAFQRATADAGPSSVQTKTPAPPAEDQGWTEVKKRRSGKSKGKGSEEAQTSKGKRNGGKAPTWAQVAQGGGVHINVYYGSGNPKPTMAQPPKRRRGKGKERKANGSGPEKRKEREGNEVKMCT